MGSEVKLYFLLQLKSGRSQTQGLFTLTMLKLLLKFKKWERVVKSERIFLIMKFLTSDFLTDWNVTNEKKPLLLFHLLYVSYRDTVGFFPISLFLW